MQIKFIRSQKPQYIVEICYSITRTRDIFQIARDLNMLDNLMWNGPTEITPIVPKIMVVCSEIGPIKRFLSECKRLKILKEVGTRI